jgi:hypothetical protein
VSPEEAALAAVIETLTRIEIPYMLTGSVAASFHGRPRTTQDADLVIDPTPGQMEALVVGLVEAGFYVDLESARKAQRDRGMFNAIEIAHACKVDLIVRRARAFSEEEFARRRSFDLPFGRAVSMVTAEDSILSKLEWARPSGESERQLADAAAIVRMNPSIDRAYIARWAATLGVADLWQGIAGAT